MAPAIKNARETPRATAPDFRVRRGLRAGPGTFPNFDNVFPHEKRPGNEPGLLLKPRWLQLGAYSPKSGESRDSQEPEASLSFS